MLLLIRVLRSADSSENINFDKDTRLSIGRDPDSDIVLDSLTASRTHAYLVYDDGALSIEDNNSINGVSVNRQKVEQAELKVGDLLEMGGCYLMVESAFNMDGVEESDFDRTTLQSEQGTLCVRVMLDAQEEDSLMFYEPFSAAIGRDPESMIVLTAPSASRHHARVDWDGEKLLIEDLDSANGVYINGYKCTSSELNPGDTVFIGGCILCVFSLDNDDIFEDADALDQELKNKVDDQEHSRNDKTISISKTTIAE